LAYPICENSEEENDVCPDVGPGWELVRHVNTEFYPHWHPATDKLLGTDVYGIANDATNDWSVAF